MPPYARVLCLGLALAAAPVHAYVIGAEPFDYPDGSIEGLTGGTGFDFDNSLANGPYVGPTSSKSDWSAAFTPAQVVSGALRTTPADSANREFNGPGSGPNSDETLGAVAADRPTTTVYLHVKMTRTAGVEWGGMSLFYESNDSLFIGVPGTTGTSGFREFGIETAGGGGTISHSGIVPNPGQQYTMVVKIDTALETTTLFLDPNLSLPEGSNSPIVTHPWTLGDAVSAVLFNCGGTGYVEWDDFSATTTWEALSAAFGPPIPKDDAIKMRHGGKVRLPILVNDVGETDPTTVVIDSAPTHGTATPSSDGFILYEHTDGLTPLQDTFTYYVSNGYGQSPTTGTVTVDFTTNARVPFTTSQMPDDPKSGSLVVENAFPGLTFVHPNAASSVNGDPLVLYIASQFGTIHLIPDVTAEPASESTFFNLAALLASRSGESLTITGESGIKGIAMHPNFLSNGYFFVSYSVKIGSTEHSRLSRFERSTIDPTIADPTSEKILFQMERPGPELIHGINDLKFGPDGYLYVSLGDAGPQGDPLNNSQTITKDLWAGILRLDVDKLPGSLEPNPHPGVILDGGVAAYAIPPDNPYVHTSLGGTWDGTFNDATYSTTAELEDIRTEYYAVGFRNPWKIDFDPLTDELYGSDVGWNDREEVNRIVAGGNYGWGFLEGSLPGPRTPPPGWSGIGPLWEYEHGSGLFQGAAVVGGVMYRGTGIDFLEDKYIFGDYGSGNIWSMDPVTLDVEWIAGAPFPVCFHRDPSNEDILVFDWGGGTINRLTTEPSGPGFPPTLSATGLFADLADLTPNPGLEYYDVNLPFWSDHAIKTRWFALPDEISMVGYQDEGAWDYPDGMIWVKHFDLELTRGNPATKKRLETRVLVNSPEGFYGVSYRWNDTGSEAILVPDSGEEFDLSINDWGTTITQTWQIPSRTQCVRCHTADAGPALSFRTRQLNLNGELAGLTGNLIDCLDVAGYLDNPPATTNGLPRHLRPDESDYSLEARVRSYFEVNCAYCHMPGGSAGVAAWDGRSSIALSEMGIINGTLQEGGTHPDDRLIVPGNINRSAILSRISETNGYNIMPPLGTNQSNQAGIQLVTDWINSEATDILTYDDWRQDEFGNTTSPEGEPGADPDGDGKDNNHEWLTNTDPNDPLDCWQPGIRAEAGDVHLDFTGLGNRRVSIWKSQNMTDWEFWQVDDNDGIPRSPGILHTISGPAADARAFFKFVVEE